MCFYLCAYTFSSLPLQLRKQARLLRREFVRAALCRHVLSWSLEEAVSDLSFLADAARHVSVIPRFPALAPLLDGFGSRMEERTRFFALTDRRVSRAILKLVALRILMGGRRISRLHIPVSITYR